MELDDDVPLTEGSLLLVFDPRKKMSGIINLLGPRLFFSPVGTNISKLVGFGPACAPVRCAHPSFGAHYHNKQGAARPPPIAASLPFI